MNGNKIVVAYIISYAYAFFVIPTIVLYVFVLLNYTYLNRKQTMNYVNNL